MLLAKRNKSLQLLRAKYLCSLHWDQYTTGYCSLH